MNSDRCTYIKDLIERFFDGETNKKENREIQRHIKVCESCRKRIVLNQDISELMTKLPEIKCPDSVTQSIFAGITEDSRKKNMSLSEELHQLFTWKNAVVGVALSAAIVFLVIKPYRATSIVPTESAYEQNKIEEAKKQALWSLSFIGSKMNKSEMKAIKEVFYNNLPKTVTKSLEQSVPILFGGDK